MGYCQRPKTLDRYMDLGHQRIPSMPLASLVLVLVLVARPKTICDPDTCPLPSHWLGLYGSIGDPDVLCVVEWEATFNPGDVLGLKATGVVGEKGNGVACPEPVVPEPGVCPCPKPERLVDNAGGCCPGAGRRLWCCRKPPKPGVCGGCEGGGGYRWRWLIASGSSRRSAERSLCSRSDSDETHRR